MEDWLRNEWEEFRLRLENTDRKAAMEQKSGAHFGPIHEALDPRVESEWLNYIEEFDRQFEQAQRIPLRQFLGDPVVKLSADVPDEMLDGELDALLEMLAGQNVAVDCICEVEDRELYRFIVEELLDEEIDDVRIPGSICHYIYEEFHPNDIYDVSEMVRSLITDLLRGSLEFREYVLYNFSREQLFRSDGHPQSWEELTQHIDAWFAIRPQVKVIETEIGVCTVDGDNAYAEADVRWTTTAGVITQGRATCWLIRSPYGGWDVVQASVPGVPL